SFMPPLLLAGAVIGTFINWRGHSEKIGQLRSDLYSDIEKRRKVLLDQLNDVFEEQVKCLSDEIINNVRESISQENFQMEYKDIWQYIQALQKYCRQVEQLLADAPEYKVVLSEVRDRLQATIDEQEELLKKTKGDYSIDSSQQYNGTMN
ncbi:hypothetical protein, partial [Mitsuokella multacida]|uniref:hypothetical protein n=1 Tax=Mitsuokella multacida TaxID=52226 RepID=UPI003FA33523